jgi:hypothetical protein
MINGYMSRLLFRPRVRGSVYKFVKEALIRRFGEDWYLELDKVAQDLKNNFKVVFYIVLTISGARKKLCS